MEITLKKPIQYDGTEIKNLTLNLESLTGQDFLDTEKETGVELTASTPVKEFSKAYLAILAAKACGMPSDMIPLLGIQDFSKITVMVQNFLLGEEYGQ